MKTIKWNLLGITVLICLLPILLGISVWESLPERLAVHFNVYGQPDGFASKGFTVFGLPLILGALQCICCVLHDFNIKKHPAQKKFELLVRWIVPVITVVVQTAILGYGLGWQLAMHRVAAFLVGGLLLVTGNYLPKLNFVKNYDLDTQKARKINRFIGFETVILGLLFLISIFLPPIFFAVCIFLLIPYTVIAVIYGIAVGKQKEN